MAHVPNMRSFQEVSHLPAFHVAMPAIADRFTELCRLGDLDAVHSESDPFSAPGNELPSLSAHDFMVRLCKYAHSSPQVFVVAIVFLQRYVDRTGTVLTSRNFHRVLLTAFVVAAKLRDDVYYTNSYYASIAGLDSQVINALEIKMLKALDWEVSVTTEEFKAMQHIIASKAKVCTQPRTFRGTDRTPDSVDAAYHTVMHPAQGSAVRAARSLPQVPGQRGSRGQSSSLARGHTVTPPSKSAVAARPSKVSVATRRKDAPVWNNTRREWTTA